MWWDPWKFYGYGPFSPFFADINGNREQVKEGDEYYHVYVNDDYVGDKEVVSQGDGGPSSVQDYLESRGFESLNIQMTGDNIRIQTDQSDQTEDIKRNLSVYLCIR
jgi:hypothetical protein